VNWTLVGWLVIALAAILTILFTILFQKKERYQIRHTFLMTHLTDSMTSALERGEYRHVGLGQSLWSWSYPGLGLQALTSFPFLIDRSSIAAGQISVSSVDGTLAVLARQIVCNWYHDGFSAALQEPGLEVTLPGITPQSYSAGLLSDLGTYKHGAMALFGYYGPEALLWCESVSSEGGYFLSASGSILAQASLFPYSNQMFIGENVYMLPGLMDPSAGSRAGMVTEDILRILLMLIMIIGAVLMVVGVL
jgi:hypothetical protein